MAIEVAIRTSEPTKINSGLTLIPFEASLKKVRRPALEAGIGALFFLSLIEFVDIPSLLKRTGPTALQAFSSLDGIWAPEWRQELT